MYRAPYDSMSQVDGGRSVRLLGDFAHLLPDDPDPSELEGEYLLHKESATKPRRRTWTDWDCTLRQMLCWNLWLFRKSGADALRVYLQLVGGDELAAYTEALPSSITFVPCEDLSAPRAVEVGFAGPGNPPRLSFTQRSYVWHQPFCRVADCHEERRDYEGEWVLVRLGPSTPFDEEAEFGRYLKQHELERNVEGAELQVGSLMRQNRDLIQENSYARAARESHEARLRETRSQTAGHGAEEKPQSGETLGGVHAEVESQAEVEDTSAAELPERSGNPEDATEPGAPGSEASAPDAPMPPVGPIPPEQILLEINRERCTVFWTKDARKEIGGASLVKIGLCRKIGGTPLQSARLLLYFSEFPSDGLTLEGWNGWEHHPDRVAAVKAGTTTPQTLKTARNEAGGTTPKTLRVAVSKLRQDLRQALEALLKTCKIEIPKRADLVPWDRASGAYRLLPGLRVADEYRKWVRHKPEAS